MSDKTYYTGEPDYVTVPGEIIIDFLEDNNIGHAECAEKMNMSLFDFEKLLNGEIEITQDFADQFEEYYGASSNLLMGLEEEYRASLKENDLQIS